MSNARGRPRGWQEGERVKSLDRALGVLAALAGRPGLGLSELGRQLGQAPATLHRILGTLAAHGMAEMDADQGWHVGPAAFRIGSAFLRRTSLVERAQPVLRALMRETGETANLGVVRDGHVLFLAQAETHAAIRAFFPPGTLSPLHASGIGKAVLAALPPERRLAALGDTLDGFTPHTLTAPDALGADLATAAARGWAIDAEERHEGMRCIACAVRDPSGAPVAGLSVSGPAARMLSAGEERIGRAVVARAQELSASLGTG
ncbi:IclR family transcriptional regulator [Hasllibacter halocynthiae]|uniref:IclR family transcriptional regulator n=1 Tax=Hasllibacter halocynthiae TaxID=595589 RepID=A0A2T0XA03_9RHOB|nr:IclR family transcriptional regulator [Hasllibacter halocynthiae]PRY95780.1 IclR family transcriptional regulator [Hasllibacter halocynthiae]